MREEVFKTELNYIKNDRLKKNAEELLKLVPDYFFEVEASSTGKYHPSFALGTGGLVRHTKVAVTIAKELLSLDNMKNNYTPDEEDLMLVALIFHDTQKSGMPKEKYTRFDHPLLAAKFIEDNKAQTEFTDDEVEFIKKAISSHMGQWNTSTYSDIVLPIPRTKYEKFVHMCDYLASRKFINVNFDDKNEIQV